MKQRSIKLLTIIGCLSIISGAWLLTPDSHTVLAQTERPELAEYIGADECASCHRGEARSHGEANHALTLQDVGRRKAGILGSFEQDEDVRTILFPGEDTARAVTEDDIAFTIGSGRHVQRYLYEVGRDDYVVLPVEWNVASQTWEPYQLTDEWPSEPYDWEQNCAYCHTTGFDVERERWEDDGVQCEACHGPGSTHEELARDAGRNPDEEELVALRSAIYTSPDPQTCGQCHSQGVSLDGRPYPVGYLPGMDLSEVFELVPNDSADHWWVTGHASQPNMQYNEWSASTHASALSAVLDSEYAADTCLTCHSEDARQTTARIAAVEDGDREGQAPDALTTADAQWGVTCASCHYAHTDSEQPFDLVQEPYALCVSCHVNPEDATGVHHPDKEIFEGVSLVEGIDSVPGTHFTAEDGPRCVTCHMQSVPVETSSRISHRFIPVAPELATAELPTACSECHSDLTTVDVGFLVNGTQASVHARLETAQEALASVLEAPADSDGQARFVRVSAALDVVSADGSLGIHNYDLTDMLLTVAERDLALLTGSNDTTDPTAEPEPTAVPATDLSTQAATPQIVDNGFRPVTYIVIGAVIILLLVAAVAFFRKPAGQEAQ